MKKTLLVILAVVCGETFSDCYARKPKKEKMTDKEIQENLDRLKNEKEKKDSLDVIFKDLPLRTGPALIPISNPMEFNMPCLEESYDTMDDIRGFGVAEGKTEEEAKEKAYREAVNQIINKMPKHIMGVTTDSESGYASEYIVEEVITEEQKRFLFTNSQIMCFRIVRLQEHTYSAYVAVRIRKTIIDSIIEGASMHSDTLWRKELEKIFEN